MQIQQVAKSSAIFAIVLARWYEAVGDDFTVNNINGLSRCVKNVYAFTANFYTLHTRDMNVFNKFIYILTPCPSK